MRRLAGVLVLGLVSLLDSLTEAVVSNHGKWKMIDHKQTPTWSDWTAWSTCTVTCGGGTIFRYRSCQRKYTIHTCDGSSRETDTCNTDACPPPVDGVWTPWEDWSSCSIGCGTAGVHTRNRSCTNPAPAHGGSDCSGLTEESKSCDPCPIDGEWGAWGAWGACDIGCGASGVHTKSRSCNNPAPQYGGVDCSGSSTDTKACDPCPVNGDWTDWSAWSDCSIGCGASGTHHRNRSCTNPAPEHGGADCSGSTEETKACNPCPIHGVWTTWTAWGACDHPCNDTVGVHLRGRTCSNPAPQHGGDDCAGSNSDSKACEPCPVDGVWTDWGAWGACSIACGVSGTRSRSRTCTNPAPLNGGQDCSGSNSDSAACDPCPLDRSTFVITDSSNYASDVAANVIDDDVSTFWHSGGSTTGQEWLQVDFGQSESIYRVLVLGRYAHTGSVSRFYGYRVYIGDTSTTDGVTGPVTGNTACATMPGTGSSSGNYYVPRNYLFDCQAKPLSGRYVTVQRAQGNNDFYQVSEIWAWNTDYPQDGSDQHAYMCFDVADYQGPAISTVSTTTIWACREACTNESGCVYFVWDSTTQDCQLKTSFTTLWHSNNIMWSGSVQNNGCLRS